MQDDYGSTFLSVSDDEGNQYQLEHLDTFEFEGNVYMAFLPADIDEQDDRYGLVIMRSGTEDGEDYLFVPEDDELERAHDEYMRILFDDEDDADAPEDGE